MVGHFKPIRWIVEPILSLFRFIPAIALTSLFLMWFGVDDTSKVALILYAAFFQVLVNTIAGVVATDHSLMEAASCMGASRLRVFFTVVLPSAVPNIHRYLAGTQQQYHLCDRGRDAGWQRRSWISDPELQDVLQKQPGRSQDRYPGTDRIRCRPSASAFRLYILKTFRSAKSVGIRKRKIPARL